METGGPCGIMVLNWDYAIKWGLCKQIWQLEPLSFISMEHAHKAFPVDGVL